jgi:Serine/threonine protein phosphatase
VKLFGSTDIGLVRSDNQDRFACLVLSPTLACAILCDGMGGEKGGSIAAEIAVQHAKEMLERDLSEGMSELTVRAISLSAISGANALIYDMAQKQPDLGGMGTTMIIAVADGEKLWISYVGDSRVYRVTEQANIQLTRDHTVVQMLVDIGEITPEDARSHPQRHYITRAVGVAPSIEPDFLTETLQPGDKILLCSDGLYLYWGDTALNPLLADCVRRCSAQPLIDLANIGGGGDNITAVVIAREEAANG